MSERPIGLLDSGIGGLTVLKEARKRLPNESFVYIGDNARNPYGTRTVEEIRQYTLELVQFLLKKQVKLIVIACNTATAVVLEELKQTCPVPVLGVIQAGSEQAANYTQTKEIGILATQSTVDSLYYNQKISEMDNTIEVKSIACPEFVDLVEKNNYQSEKAEKIVKNKLASIKNTKIDSLVLGCTHFPLLAPFIQETVGKNVKLIDSGALTAKKIEQILTEKNLAADQSNSSVRTNLYTTGDAQLFKNIAEKWMDEDLLNVRKINV